MAYTDPWSDTRPLGSSLASQGDDEIRLLRLAIHERMNVLVDDWTADPVVAKASVSGHVVGKRLLVPFSSFVFTVGEDSVPQYTDAGGLLLYSAGVGAYAPLILQSGVTVTRIQWMVDNLGANTSTFGIRSQAFGTVAGLETPTPDLTTADAGVQVVDSGAISFPYTIATLYHLRANPPSSGSSLVVYGAQILYTVPDSRYTI